MLNKNLYEINDIVRVMRSRHVSGGVYERSGEYTLAEVVSAPMYAQYCRGDGRQYKIEFSGMYRCYRCSHALEPASPEEVEGWNVYDPKYRKGVFKTGCETHNPEGVCNG